MEFVEERFPELIEEDKTSFSDGEKYYWLDSDGNVYPSFWENDSVDEGRLLIGNIFKTEEEAEFEVERRKILHELEALGSPFDRGFRNYYLAFDYFNEEISIDFRSNLNSCFSNCFFNSKEDAQKAIDKIGEDRIKKYLFGAED